jgi:hypothetical protein
MCAVKLTVNKKEFNIFGVYRPLESQSDFNTFFFALINKASILNSNSIFLGDFNCDISAPSLPESSETFISEFRSFHFIPVISVPTRLGSNGSVTLIDHIWTNSMTPYEAGVFPIDVSDHYPIFLSLPGAMLNSEEKIKCKFRCHSGGTLGDLKLEVSRISEQFGVYDGLDAGEACGRFCDLLFAAYERTCPIKTKIISIKRLNNPWLNDELQETINIKHKLYRLSMMDSSYCDTHVYYRNKTTVDIRNAKRKYFGDKFNACQSDIKKTWASINSILKPDKNSKKHEHEISLKDNDQIVSDPVRVTNLFNEYFTTIADNLARNIPPVNKDPLEYVTNTVNSFALLPTDPTEILQIIGSFKSKGSNLDTIPSFVFKHVASELSSVVSCLINRSFAEGQFPNSLKVARVIPIFKSGPRDMASNYRPISTLEFLSKVYEKAMCNRLLNFLGKYNLICDQQYGFRANCSTSDAVLRFTDSVYGALNRSKYLIAVLLDLSKAFDTVDYGILFGKLYKLGVRGLALEWIKSYLSNRYQYVCVKGVNSQKLPISSGVPQGSVLGPLLFLLYIDDMNKSSHHLNFVHFADDTTLFLEGDNLNSVYDNVNAELVKVDEWLRCNKLSLNVDKTSFMLFSNRSKETDKVVIMRGAPLNRTIESKFLGITIDDGLSFKVHINNVCSKLSMFAGILYRLSCSLPGHVLRKVYLSLVYPHLLYGVEVWGCSSQTQLSRLSALQKKCIKLFSIDVSRAEDMYLYNNLLPLDSIFKYFCTLNFFKYFRMNHNRYFLSIINNAQVDHDIPTRFKTNNQLNCLRFNLSRCHCSFTHQSLKLWNALPVEIRSIQSFYAFKLAVRSFYSR